MSCVIDFNRFQALQDGINTLNNEFNFLAVQRLADSRNIELIKKALTHALSFYQRVTQLNIFITEGA